MKSDKLSNYNVIIILIVAVLSIYKSPVPRIDLGTFLIIASIVINIVGMKRLTLPVQEFKVWGVFVIYIIFVTLMSPEFIKFQDLSYIWMRTTKNILIMFYMFMVYIGRAFDLNYAFSKIKLFCTVATYFLFFQLVMAKLFGINVPGYFLQLCSSDYYIERATASISSSDYFRLTSFFPEPAHYSSYMILALLVCLFYDESKKELTRGIFFTVGIVASTSGQGLFYIGIVWSIWLFLGYKRAKVSLRQFCFRAIVMLTGLIALVVFLNSQTGQFVMERIFGYTHQGNAIEGRIIPYLRIFNESYPIFLRLFGFGYANVDLTIFYSTWAYNIWCLGLIGTLLCLAIYRYYYKINKSNFIRVALLVNIIMGVFTTTFNGITMLLWFSFIMNYDSQTEAKTKVKEKALI